MREDIRLFGNDLLDHHVTLVFGNGIFSLRGDVVAVHRDFIEVRDEKDGAQIHVPLASIVYARVGVKRDV